MNKQHLLFMSGFPRAGSTLLMNILNQNPKFYGTPTSGLIGSFINLRDNWRNNDIYRSNGEEYTYPKIQSMLKYMLLGFYYEQIENGITPIDKNRTWTGQIDLLDELFGTKVKIIFPIRNVADCCISMEVVNRKSTATNHGDNGNALNEQTTRGRAQNFLKDEGIFGTPIMYLRELMYRGETDRLVFVPYEDLLKYPQKMLERIHNDLELPQFTYDFNNIKQTVIEHDLDHGFAPNSLHKIKEGKLLPPSSRKTDVLSVEDINGLEETYKDINELILKNSISI